MHRFGFVLVPLLVLAGGAGIAHEGVKNAAVMARMTGMKEIGAQMKVLGSMAKGAVAFDTAATSAALAAVSAEAAKVPALFEAPEDDPKSEAVPAIWTNWEDFTAKAAAMQTAAQMPVSSADDLAAAMRALGGTCKACHSAYRE